MNVTQVYSFESNRNVTKLTLSKDGTDWFMLFLIPIIVLVALGNVLVIISVCLDRRLRSSTNYFLTSLAVADLLVALVVMPPSLGMIMNNYKWPFSDELCGVWAMLDVFFSTSSILHLCMISLDRYIALSRPFARRSEGSLIGRFKYRNYDKLPVAKSVAIRICTVWTMAIGIAIPLPVLGAQDRSNLFIGDTCAINVREFAIFGSLVAFLLPLIIMFVTYTLTILTLRKQAREISAAMDRPQGGTLRTARNVEQDGDGRSLLLTRQHSHVSGKEWKCSEVITPDYSALTKALRQVQALFGFGVIIPTSDVKSPNTNRTRERNNNFASKISLQQTRSSTRRMSGSFKQRVMTSITNEQRASKVLGLIFVLFCVFWCPFFITNVVSHLCDSCDQDLMGSFMNWFVWVGYVSSGVNPCVYTLFSKRFRETFFNVLRGRFAAINRRTIVRDYKIREGSNSSYRTAVESTSRRSSCQQTSQNSMTLKSRVSDNRTDLKQWRTTCLDSSAA